MTMWCQRGRDIPDNLKIFSVQMTLFIIGDGPSECCRISKSHIEHEYFDLRISSSFLKHLTKSLLFLKLDNKK